MIIEGKERHDFVCTDPRTGRLVWINKDGTITRELSGIHSCFDLWILPDNRILYPHYGGDDGDGFTVLNEDGSVSMRYITAHEVFGCQPLANGNILVGELGQKRLVEVDRNSNITLEIPIQYNGVPHECMRMVRKYGDFYYVVQPGINKIRKLSQNGDIVKEYSIRDNAFGIVVMQSGNIVYTCMSGAYELTPNGCEVWSLTDADVPGINIRWLLGLQSLSNGNLVFSNWMGHGHHDEGIHFFEVDREKKVVWSFDGRGTLSEPAALQILDETPTNVCYTPLK